MTTTAPPLVARLVGELERLPASRATALRVVRLVDDPRAGAADVAAAAAPDPALTARLVRLANSAYYGLSGRVGSVAFAVTVVGFTTVRGLASLAAAGLADADALPPGSWERAAGAAAAASLVAARTGASEPDAFCAGLLHDLGSALLRRADRARWDAVLAEGLTGAPLLRAQEQAFGGTPAALCADVLRAWQFPDALCDAVADQHCRPHVLSPALTRALHAGLALAALEADGGCTAPTSAEQLALSVAGIRTPELPGLLREVGSARRQLAAALQ